MRPSGGLGASQPAAVVPGLPLSSHRRRQSGGHASVVDADAVSMVQHVVYWRLRVHPVGGGFSLSADHRLLGTSHSVIGEWSPFSSCHDAAFPARHRSTVARSYGVGVPLPTRILPSLSWLPSLTGEGLRFAYRRWRRFEASLLPARLHSRPSPSRLRVTAVSPGLRSGLASGICPVRAAADFSAPCSITHGLLPPFQGEPGRCSAPPVPLRPPCATYGCIRALSSFGGLLSAPAFHHRKLAVQPSARDCAHPALPCGHFRGFRTPHCRARRAVRGLYHWTGFFRRPC